MSVGLGVVMVAGCASSSSNPTTSEATSSPETSVSEPETTPPSTATSSTTTTLRSSTTAGGDAGVYEEVEFTSQGETLSGRLFGEGKVGVVLTYMGRSGDSQDDWVPLAEELADNGYLVPTYQRPYRRTDVWQNLIPTSEFLRERGAEKVIGGGASIGAMATLYSAGQPGANLDGLIWLAGVRAGSGYRFQEEDVADLSCPMLFISGDEDGYGAAADTRDIHGWATAPSELLIIESAQHGTDLFTESLENHRVLTNAILDFVAGVATESTSC